MALHELSTNAAKYGALSNNAGKVLIRWGVADDTFTFTWEETGGPPVDAPTRRGFGSRMIEQALASYFHGNVELSFKPNGLCFTLNAPMSGLL